MEKIFTATIAFGLVGLIFSLLLAFLSKKLKVNEDPQVKKILDLLPGLSCGACGYSGCRAYAQAVAEDTGQFKRCLPAGDDINQKILKLIGGKDAFVAATKKIIVCACGAKAGEKKVSSIYQGLSSCQAGEISKGALDCLYGCFGFGDCQKACPTQAITIENKKVYIDQDKCLLCGKCIKICPRNLFKIIPRNEKEKNYFIACQNKDKLKEVKAVCSRGCISCRLCAQGESSYQIKENLSQINYKAIDLKSLEKGKNKCPTKCIKTIDQ